MIIVVAALEFDTQEARDRAVELTRDVQLATRVEEAGCHDYCFAPDPCVDTRIQVYELWTDEESLAAHFQHPNYFNMGMALRDCGISGSDNRKYRVDATEPVYDDSHTPRADFFTRAD